MTNEQKRSIAISIRISPEELKMLENLTEVKHQTKTAVIISALTLYAQSLTAAETPNPETATPGTPSPAPEEISPQSITGATETPPEAQQESQPDYISKAGNAPQRAAENATERAGEDQPGQVRIYTEAELRQAIQEAAQQAATQAARQARQEIKREMRSQAIQATGMTIGAARRAKASTVSAVNGLKPLRIKRPKK